MKRDRVYLDHIREAIDELLKSCPRIRGGVFRGTALMRICFEAASAALAPRERRVDRGF